MTSYKITLPVMVLLHSLHMTDTVNNTCPKGFSGPTCEKANIAFRKHTIQSSTWNGFDSSLAVDGDPNTNLDVGGTCATTNNDNPSSWTVEIDPVRQYNITQMTLYLRNSNSDRYQNMRIFVNDDLCTTIDISDVYSAPSPNPVNVTGCTQPLTGNTVRIQVDNGFLTLCEVQIWVCSDGWFGWNCNMSCNCLNDSDICDKENGYCRSGCAKGYHGDGCQTDCKDGYFGNCSQKCNCQNHTEICNKGTGLCGGSGCKIGTYEPDCQIGCTERYYGINCTSSCGQCHNSAPCDSVSGSCPSGCQAGYSPPLCKNCLDGIYGDDCASVCGNCSNGEICDKVSGECPNGCQTGYSQPFCKARLTNPKSGGDNSLPVWAIIGGVLAFLVLIAIGLGALFLIRKKGAHKNTLSRDSDKNNQSTEVNSFEGTITTSPPLEAPGQDGLYEIVNDCCSNLATDIPLDSLKYQVRKKINEGELETEFKMIRYGVSSEHEAGKRPENKKRNRFVELFPYDHSRVKLIPDGKSTWDYINASFVSGFSDKTIFIAAQGPNAVTVHDFWRMVWQHYVTKIVMLTRVMEMNKKKCEQYWPEGDEAMQCGNITIQKILSTVRADFTIRKFKIQHTDSPIRIVTQYHFTSWPDHDVPATCALVGFWKQVKLTNSKTDDETGPTVIHCSAGVGRTGTFIALDSLVTQAETENKVNVFMFVAKMREARMNMVQTAKQYQFVHEALVEALESRGTFYTASEFDRKYGSDLSYTAPQEDDLRRQFKALESLKVELNKDLVSDALAPENVKKNKSLNILPGNRTRPGITTPVTGHNNYINAVILPSATRSKFFIVTQTPLPETVVDFWRLVFDHDCYIIVCLDDSKDSTTLYPHEGMSSTIGPFHVETEVEDKSQGSYVFTKMTITKKDKDDSKRELKMYRFVSMDTAPNQRDTTTVLDFINVLHHNSIGDDHKMLVHCFDGSRVSGVFCSVMNIVSRLRLDKDVDIFLTIRELQTARPQFVQTYDQYKLCHDIVKEYNRSADIYTNM